MSVKLTSEEVMGLLTKWCPQEATIGVREGIGRSRWGVHIDGALAAVVTCSYSEGSHHYGRWVLSSPHVPPKLRRDWLSEFGYNKNKYTHSMDLEVLLKKGRKYIRAASEADLLRNEMRKKLEAVELRLEVETPTYVDQVAMCKAIIDGLVDPDPDGNAHLHHMLNHHEETLGVYMWKELLGIAYDVALSKLEKTK